ncbi:MAG: response regulator transcription factor [Candidatus Methylacidiphilales bacterium]|nr:response regulator [Candidatus Methylacidiphilales bacterium]
MAKILVIDDTASDAMLLVLTAKKDGHECLVASDGKAGEQLAVANLPELILLDIVMPGQDGFATCRRLKKNSATAHIPVILVSSKNTEADRFWGLKQGASDYIDKPFQPSTLLEAIRRHLPVA